jgi:hypothetical protein
MAAIHFSTISSLVLDPSFAGTRPHASVASLAIVAVGSCAILDLRRMPWLVLCLVFGRQSAVLCTVFPRNTLPLVLPWLMLPWSLLGTLRGFDPCSNRSSALWCSIGILMEPTL